MQQSHVITTQHKNLNNLDITTEKSVNMITTQHQYLNNLDITTEMSVKSILQPHSTAINSFNKNTIKTIYFMLHSTKGYQDTNNFSG